MPIRTDVVCKACMSFGCPSQKTNAFAHYEPTRKVREVWSLDYFSVRIVFAEKFGDVLRLVAFKKMCYLCSDFSRCIILYMHFTA